MNQELLRWKNKQPPGSPKEASSKVLTRHARDPACGEDALLLRGDNLEILSHLLATGHQNTVDVVYLDPPFGSNARYAREIRLRGEPERRLGKQEQYTDLLPRDDYLQFMYERLLLLYDLLAPNGSMLLHADEHSGHLLRCLLDEIFGADAFVNEIIWHYPDNFQGNVRGLAHNHNAIHWYAKGPKYTSNNVRVPLPKPVKRDRRVWSKEERRVVAARDEHGKILYDTYTDRKADDVWSIGQSAVTKRRSGEYLGYPTQKPIVLLERLLLATSNPGDLVLDPFAGSGTTAAAAQRLGRRWISCDRNPISIQTTAIRLRAELESDSSPEAAAQHAFAVVAIGDQADTASPPGDVQVETRKEGDTLEMQVVAFSNPSLQALLEGEMPEDWRRLVECIQVDPAFDGEVFRPTICDRPARTRDLVSGSYRVDANTTQVALRLTDVAGNEVTWMLNA